KVQKWFRKWKKLIAKHWGKKPFFEKSSIKASAVSMVVGLTISICGILMIKYVAGTGFISIIFGLILFALSFAIWRYPREIKKIIKELSAFKKYLKNYHFRNETARQHGMRLEDLFIYGIALGVAAKVIEQLVALSPDFQQRYFTWYHPYAAYSSSKDFAHAVSSMVSATSSTMSSSTGTGGGASGGGGGGGGGASGGAG
ncbi:DUF2207 domain-containing protein, partial [candidate division KSB1 bacterium]|nr:DUF2207 domain-containing protein [candidate division KSB1 bacterium]